MKILIFGDISTWNIPNFSIKKLNPKIIKQIKSADYVIYNLEGPIAIPGKKYKLQLRENLITDFLYKLMLKLTNKEQPIVYSNPKILELLKLNKNTIVTLANNHIKDLGKTGFEDTINVLKDNKIKYLGAGMNEIESTKDLIFENFVLINTNWVASEKNGIKFKVYNAANQDYGGAYQSLRVLGKKVQKYRDENKKAILVVHCGKELPTNEKTVGVNLKGLLALRADTIVLHHFHVYLKTNYELRNIFILGDFIFFRPNKLKSNRKSSYLRINNFSNHFIINTHINKSGMSDLSE